MIPLLLLMLWKSRSGGKIAPEDAEWAILAIVVGIIVIFGIIFIQVQLGGR